MYRGQNDLSCSIALKMSCNARDASPLHRNFPIMACLQQWSYGVSFTFGAHNGQQSNFLYPDGHVMPMEFDFRGLGQTLFSSNIEWDIYTTMYP